MLSKRIGVRLCVWLLVLPLLIVLVLGVAAASDQKTEREIQGWLPRHWPLLAAPLVVGGVVHAVWTARRSPNSDVQCARRLQRRPRGIWTSQEFDARQKVRRPSDMQVHACEYCGEEVWFKESQRGGLVECPHCSEMCDIPHVPA